MPSCCVTWNNLIIDRIEMSKIGLINCCMSDVQIKAPVCLHGQMMNAACLKNVLNIFHFARRVSTYAENI